MAAVRIVLVRPENSANVGAAARVVTNMGLAGLDLVSPGDWRTVETWRMAWRAEDTLEQARVFPALEEALTGAVYTAGLTGRPGHRVRPETSSVSSSLECVCGPLYLGRRVVGV